MGECHQTKASEADKGWANDKSVANLVLVRVISNDHGRENLKQSSSWNRKLLWRLLTEGP